MSESVFLSKQFLAIRSARGQHWVITVTGRSEHHSERILEVLYEKVSASDHSARLNLQFDAQQQVRNKGEEPVP